MMNPKTKRRWLEALRSGDYNPSMLDSFAIKYEKDGKLFHDALGVLFDVGPEDPQHAWSVTEQLPSYRVRGRHVIYEYRAMIGHHGYDTLLPDGYAGVPLLQQVNIRSLQCVGLGEYPNRFKDMRPAGTYQAAIEWIEKTL